MIVNRGPQLVQLMKGYSMAAVGRIEQLAPAVLAGGDVGGDELVGIGVYRALEDDEGVARGRTVGGDAGRHLPALQRGDVAAWRRFRGQGQGERVHVGGLPLHEDLHAGRRVTHPAHQAVPLSEPVHEGAKADALHDPAHVQPGGGFSLCGVRSVRQWDVVPRDGPGHPGQLNW